MHNFLFLLLILFSFINAEATTSWQETVELARETLPQEGILILKDEKGFTYVKVDDDYIHALLPLLELEEEGFREPPYFRGKNSPGAHISVFYEDENVIADEIGQTFHFTLEQIVIVKTSKNVSWVVLQVKSPELEALRVKYGKSPLLHGHEFHITLGKKGR